jgi:chorismate-pyruvate lyase
MTYPPIGPTLADLLGLFPETLVDAEAVPADTVPQPYHDLLVHTHHMTVTVEQFHGDRVNVQILDLSLTETWYARKILLVTQGDRRVVQFGIVRIWLSYLAPAVRHDILMGGEPLGRILIRHDVLRRVEPTGFLRIAPSDDTRQWFGEAGNRETYGRLGVIYCDGHPAIEVLEIVAPCEAG